MKKKLKTFSIKVPEELVKLTGGIKKTERKILELLMLRLKREGKITASKGAEVLGCSYNEFLDLMAENDIPIINYDPNEVDQGLKTFETFPIKQKGQ